MDSAEPSPLPAPGAPSDDGGLFLRGRKEDRNGQAHDGQDDPVLAAKRIALARASATLEQNYALTAAHSDDVVSLCEAIAERLGVSGSERKSILAAAALHDIGKVAIPQEVIDKPGPLEPGEWDVVQRHTVAGERIISSVPDMDGVAQIVRWSHERWDGGGYPDGLAGDDIPLGSRIIFCADAFHAIRCDRPYRPGQSADRALAEVRQNAGTQFDPQIVAALDDVARRLRSSSLARVGALAGGLRSRRAALLLLALAVAGSAMAATDQGPFRGLFGSDAATRSAACAPAGCLPADLGALGDPFPAALTHATTGSAARHSGGRRPRRSGSGTAVGRRRGDDTSGGSVTTGGESGGNSRAGAGDGGNGPHKPGGSAPGPAGRPDSPGRSGEAPGKPARPGKPPTAGAPGRSEEAPGKPQPRPGQFGQGNTAR